MCKSLLRDAVRHRPALEGHRAWGDADNYETIWKDIGTHNQNTRRKERQNREEIFWVIMIKNFPNLIIDTRPHIQKLSEYQAGLKSKQVKA